MLGAADVSRPADVLPDQFGDALLLRQIRIDLRSCGSAVFLLRCTVLLRIIARGDLRAVQCKGNFPVIRRIRDKHGCCRLIAFRADGIGVKFKQKLPLLHRIALCHMRGKVFSLKFHRIYSDMDKQVHTICGMNADGMFRRKEHGHLSIDR